MNIDNDIIKLFSRRLARHFKLDLQEVDDFVVSFFFQTQPSQTRSKVAAAVDADAAPNKKTRKDLVAIAANLGIKVPSSWTKPKIQKAIDSALIQPRVEITKAKVGLPNIVVRPPIAVQAENQRQSKIFAAKPENKTRKELVILASSLGIRVPSSWTKIKIQEAIDKSLVSLLSEEPVSNSRAADAAARTAELASNRAVRNESLKIKKSPCERNKKSDVILEAQRLGVPVLDVRGKERTVKALCADIKSIYEYETSSVSSETLRPPSRQMQMREGLKKSPYEKNKKSDVILNKTFRSVKGNVWTFGQLLGSGGFGAVYQENKNPGLVIKTGRPGLLQNQTSGVFFEKSVLGKLLGSDGDSRGVPQIIDSGKLPNTIITNDYFIILPKFDYSLEDSMFKIDSQYAKLTPVLVNNVMSSILNALSYINEKGYLHLDVKPANIMTRNNRWYLIDYGLAYAYRGKENKIDPRVKNTGTAWYMSRDVHKGRLSRKCDLESLVFMLMELDKVKVPWSAKGVALQDYELLSSLKQSFFDTYQQYNIPDLHKKFVETVNKLVPGSAPDYSFLRRLFVNR